MEQQTGFKEMFLRLVAIVGLIAVLILGAWGIILLAFNLVGLFTGSVHLSNLFTHPTSSQVATTTQVVIAQNDSGNSPDTASTAASKPAGSTAQAGNATAVYTAAPRAASLYGFADLSVSITAVNSLSSVAGRTVVTFTVTNAGTNVAPAGWSFTAQLPLEPAYTYQSAPQQALYPGDSIAYTLTYDDPNYYGYNNGYNQYCTQQYPYNCNNSYYNQYPYNYNQTCYTYNGYTNVAGPCPVTYDQYSNAVYNNTNSYAYTYNAQYPYNQNYGYYNQNQYAYRTVTITVDPQHLVPEANEYNNTASKSF